MNFCSIVFPLATLISATCDPEHASAHIPQRSKCQLLDAAPMLISHKRTAIQAYWCTIRKMLQWNPGQEHATLLWGAAACVSSEIEVHFKDGSGDARVAAQTAV